MQGQALDSLWSLGMTVVVVRRSAVREQALIAVSACVERL